MKNHARKRALAVFPILLLAMLAAVPRALAQGTTASLSILVQDPSEAVIPGAQVTISSVDTGLHLTLKTNHDGVVIFPSLQPIRYALSIRKQGFAETVVDTFKLDVAAAKSLSITLKVGRANEVVTVDGSAAALNTTDGTVSTVIDRQLIENMPLNGKDMTTLFELSPGTVMNAGGTGPESGGGFSVDGQRPTANYLSIDGASGNSYIPTAGGKNVTGATIATSASGGTNGVLPIDAIEEYRMDTSTYTAENGRTPGGQIQVRTRSGTNVFHGTLFENFRNQVLDATDWFVKYDNLKQAQLRMNDFGGTLGGPVLKNKLFFFAAHDTLLLDQPNTVSQSVVPDQSIIQSAYPTFKTWMGVFPAGNGGADPSYVGYDFFSESFPDIIRDHTTSIRVDALFPRNIHGFFRANLAPSYAMTTGITDQQSSVNIYTYTGGVTVPLKPNLVDDLTVNRTSTATRSVKLTASVGGNDPNALQNSLPPGVKASTDLFEFALGYGGRQAPYTTVGPQDSNSLYQWNAVDTLSWTKGKHLVKFGADFLTRGSSIIGAVNSYIVETASEKTPPLTSLQNGTITTLDYSRLNDPPVINLQNTSAFVNDGWQLRRSLTLNLGLRWEYNPAPSVTPLGTFVVQNNSLSPSTITAAISNKSLYENKHDNLAPRFGFAWSPPNQDRLHTVIRGGVGTYFDTGQAATVSQAASTSFPYVSSYASTTPQPYASINFTQLTGTSGTLPTGTIYLVDPKLLSPRTYEWSLTIEQEITKSSRLSLSYVGNDGEQLAGDREYYNKINGGQYPVNPALVTPNGYLFILTNQSHSNYQALQAQLTSRVNSRLDALLSYTWGHAEDNGSTDFSSVGAAAPNPIANSANDLRHIFAAAIHYTPNSPTGNRLLRSIVSGWQFDTIARLQTASPMTVTVAITNPEAFQANADVIPGQPTILRKKYNSAGQLIPGGKLLNFSAFAAPPTDASGSPLRQGDSPTNGYRLFGLTQWDVAMSRSWSIWEGVNLRFRVDAFNILNIPNFADVNNGWYPQGEATFGEAANTYAGNFGANAAELGISGSQLSTFQNGGPRELQLSMHLQF